MIERLIMRLLSMPKRVYLSVVLLALCGLSAFPWIVIDTDPENMLPENNAQRMYHQQVKTQFQMHDMIVVGLTNVQHANGVFNRDSLDAAKHVTASVLALPNVIKADVSALSVVDNILQDEPGTIRFEWLMQQIPQHPDEQQQLASSVRRLPMLHNTLVSADKQALAIYVPVKDKAQSYAVAEQIRATIAEYIAQHGTQAGHWYITGLPIAEAQFGYEMFVQMAISAPLAGLAIAILLFVFFKQWQLVVAPMVIALVTVIASMGALIATGFEVHILSSMIAIFLMPIAVVDSVHVLSDFADEVSAQTPIEDTAKQVVARLFQPMLFTSLTSAVGFFSLLLTPIPPVQIFGFFIGVGILLAFVLTMTFLPVYLSRLSPCAVQQLVHWQTRRANKATANRSGLLLSQRFAIWLMRPLVRLGVVFTALGLFVVSVLGLSHIQINDNPIKWFHSAHDIRVADRALNQHFAGTYDAFLVMRSTNAVKAVVDARLTAYLQNEENNAVVNALIQQQRDQFAADGGHLARLLTTIDDYLYEHADTQALAPLEALYEQLVEIQQRQKTFLSPEVLAYQNDLIADLQTSGLIGKSNSLVDIIKTVHRELYSGTDADFILPATANAVAQVLLQYQSSHRPQDLWHFVTPDYRDSLIWLQLRSGDNQDMQQVVDYVERYVNEHPLPEGVALAWAGKTYLNLVWQERMVAGMLTSLAGAFVVVFVMMALLFRSLIVGLLAMLPLSLTIVMIYGVIGWVGKDYDMPIAVLSALTLGLSVDFAIHFIERARGIYRDTCDGTQTLKQLFEAPSRAIVRNAFIIALGFTPLLFAPLLPYVTVGVFLAAIMLLSALVTLLLLPALMPTFHHALFSATRKTERESTTPVEPQTTPLK